MYQWHLAFDDQPKMLKLASVAQSRLAGPDGLHLIEPRLLHLTPFIVGFVDEISAETIRRLIGEAEVRPSRVAPIPVTIGRLSP